MLRVPFAPLCEGEVVLGAEAARYVARVHRLAAGDRLLLFDPEERLEAEGEIVELERDRLRVRLARPRATTRLAARPLTVIQCLPKGAKLDAVVRDATELGATRVVVAVAARSVRRPDKLDRWRRIALEAARQCLRGDVPELLGPLPFSDALSEALADAQAEHAGAIACILHPEGGASFAAVLGGASPDAAVCLAIGPEGGFEPGELAAAEQLGFVRVTLGRFVLRTETACAAALGAVAAFRE
jgi:16S rRNA (uracil1498-N3)-methyltransferase